MSLSVQEQNRIVPGLDPDHSGMSFLTVVQVARKRAIESKKKGAKNGILRTFARFRRKSGRIGD